MMELTYRPARTEDADTIWIILQQAIYRRRSDGSDQWQDGYPNFEIIKTDIRKQQAFVFILNDKIVAYSALIFNNEPAYAAIKGEWLSNEDFLVVHRVAVSDDVLGKGVATRIFKIIENHALNNNVFSLKVDTNFDNIPMLKILGKAGYQYCGEVLMRGGNRKAFEKILNK